MATLPDPDVTLNAFVAALRASAEDAGWTLVRFEDGRSDRDFEARGDGRRASFTAKISQTETGFWGLTATKSRELEQSGDHLILLTGANSGYFISGVAFARLLPKFSRTQDASVRINEGIVRRETRFSQADEAFELLKARSVERSG